MPIRRRSSKGPRSHLDDAVGLTKNRLHTNWYGTVYSNEWTCQCLTVSGLRRLHRVPLTLAHGIHVRILSDIFIYLFPTTEY